MEEASETIPETPLQLTASAPGYHGELSVTLTIDSDGKMHAVEVGENEETQDIGTLAIEKIPSMIVEAQSLDVDVISGATKTTKGIVNAVANALEAGGYSAEAYGFKDSMKIEMVSISAFDAEMLPEKVPTTSSITVNDVKGRAVTIDLPISTYAISTMDVIDFIIPLKGQEAFDMLVGSGQDGGGGFQKYAQLYVPVVGDYMVHVGQISDHNAPFDLEMILATQPDVLFVNSAMGAHRYALEVEPQLTAAGIQVVLIDVPGKDLKNSVSSTLKLLGDIFEVPERAEEVAGYINDQYAIIEEGIANAGDAPTVYYEKSGYAEIYGPTATSMSGWGLPINMAGGKNIADEILMGTATAGGAGNTIDPEYVLEADPDIIVVSGINDGWLDAINDEKETYAFDIVNRIGWQSLHAIEEGKLYEFAHSTSRSIFAFYPTMKMATLFYPDTFSELDPEAALDVFFDRFMLTDSSISTWFIPYEE
ncbi:ABC transporter substrate-binding protein [Fusibacter paucivorans]|uniref:ABC transporter substrate-binding protein n=2 Tax=Fusibacter paucivorans TaxID=76009 RepID=A0ABS5PP61_9FIRM|nr:ABC transporter substrate-binding protein [Fusibacter paucivorans]